MADPKLTRLTQLFVKKQSGDIYEDPAATDDLRLNEGFTGTATPEAITRDILTNSFTPVADMVGIKSGTFTGVSEMYGADYTDGTTTPYFNDLFESVQLIPTKVTAIPVSAISANFVHNEIVTGGTSSAVGRVVVPTELTDTVIYIVLTSGVFQAENITGDVAGDATATGVDIDAGWSYKFDSFTNDRISARWEQDGQISQLYNAVPTLTITADDSNIPMLNYEILGVMNTIADVEQWQRDGVNTTVVRDTLLPPLFQCARLKQNDFIPVVDSTLTLDLAIENPLRRNANSCVGVEGVRVTGRTPTLAYTIDTPLNSEDDVFLNWFNTEDTDIEFRFGTDVGNTFWFFTPTAKLQTVAPVDTDGYAKLEQTYKLTGQDDQELEIICI